MTDEQLKAIQVYRDERQTFMSLLVQNFLDTMASRPSFAASAEALAEMLADTYLMGADHGFRAAAA